MYTNTKALKIEHSVNALLFNLSESHLNFLFSGTHMVIQIKYYTAENKNLLISVM